MTEPVPVLVVDDDAHVREALCQTLDLAGYAAHPAASFIVAKDHMGRDFSGVILSDIRMPGRDGLHLLDHALSVDPDHAVVLLTGEGDIPMAVEAISRGAFDFLEKPCANETLLDSVRRAARARGLVIENRRLRAALANGDAAARMIYGISDKAAALRDTVRKIAPFDGPVLIEGSPGSGVANVAEVIHRLSGRGNHPFQRIAGAGLTRAGLTSVLQAAGAGTLFIKEYAAAPMDVQFALLEHVDAGGGARVVAGSTFTAGTGTGTGTGSEGANPDLYYRLGGLQLRIPALRDRPEDIPVLFRHYVREASQRAGVPEPEVTAAKVAELMARDWPGNSTALRNAATRFVLRLDDAGPGDSGPGLAEKLAQVERLLIVEALQRNNGHASATAEQLRLPRKTFYDKLARHGIKPEDYRV